MLAACTCWAHKCVVPSLDRVEVQDPEASLMYIDKVTNTVSKRIVTNKTRKEVSDLLPGTVARHLGRAVRKPSELAGIHPTIFQQYKS